MDREKVVSEIKKQLILAGPQIIAIGLQFILPIISNMFVGHLGELALSGVSMATSFAGVTGFSFLLGMASALDTLCGQAYGAKQHHMLGIHMQRAMLVLMLVCIPVAVVWAFTGSILVLLHENKHCTTTWTGFSKEAFRDVYNFIKLTITDLILAVTVFGD